MGRLSLACIIMGVTVRRTIKERVESSFSKDDKDKIYQYLEWLRIEMSDLTQDIRRMTLVLLLLIAAFEFLLGEHGTRITLGVFKIGRGSVAVVLIPALVAYLYLQIYFDSIRINRMRRVFRETFSYWSSLAAASELDMYVLPRFYLFWSPGLGAKFQKGNEPRVEGLVRFTGMTLMLVIVTGLIAFEIQAYAVLRKPESPEFNILWIASLCIAAFCIGVTAIYGVLVPTGRRA